jgi:hypothetical protein
MSKVGLMRVIVSGIAGYAAYRAVDYIPVVNKIPKIAKQGVGAVVAVALWAALPELFPEYYIAAQVAEFADDVAGARIAPQFQSDAFAAPLTAAEMKAASYANVL